MRRLWCLFAGIALAALGHAAAASAPDRSLVPVPRPGQVVSDLQVAAALAGAQAAGRSLSVAPGTEIAPPRSLRPRLRTARNLRRARRAQDRLRRRQDRAAAAGRRTGQRQRQQQPERGSVCGDRTIRGEPVAPIAGAIRGCGVEHPVRITEVNGVRLTQASVMTCDTATALKHWVDTGVRPAVGQTGGGVAGLRVFAHYACRTRNNQRGARISEHGKGRAIDIGAIILRNGEEISVERNWRSRSYGAILQRVHAAACGPFGTVLGPNADRHHYNHFHFDTAAYRSGAYCR